MIILRAIWAKTWISSLYFLKAFLPKTITECILRMNHLWRDFSGKNHAVRFIFVTTREKSKSEGLCNQWFMDTVKPIVEHLKICMIDCSLTFRSPACGHMEQPHRMEFIKFREAGFPCDFPEYSPRFVQWSVSDCEHFAQNCTIDVWWMKQLP